MRNHATDITSRVRLSLGGLDSFENLIKSMNSLLLKMHAQELPGNHSPPVPIQLPLMNFESVRQCTGEEHGFDDSPGSA